MQAFQEVFDRHGEAVLRFLVAAVGPDDAQDCFQETFVAALRAYPSLQDESKLRAWVLTIANRKALDVYRRRRREAVPLPVVPDIAIEPLPGEEFGVWDAVRCLPPKQRAAIVHRFANDLTYEDVGRVLGCTPEAARRNVHVGLKTLRRTWTP